MASSGTLLRKLEDQVTCSVCLEIYDDPQVLKCQHSLCKKCLPICKNAQQQLKCPQCRQLTGEGDISSNLTLKNLLDLYKEEQDKAASDEHYAPERKKKKGGEDWCDLCELHSAMFCCVTCKNFLCESCKRSHSKLSACQEDKVRDLESLAAEYTQTLNEKYKPILQNSLAEISRRSDCHKTENYQEAQKTFFEIRLARIKVKQSVEKHYEDLENKVELGLEEHEKEILKRCESLTDRLNMCQKIVENLQNCSSGQMIKKYDEVVKRISDQSNLVQQLQLPSFRIIHKQQKAAFQEVEALDIHVSDESGVNSKFTIKDLIGKKLKVVRYESNRYRRLCIAAKDPVTLVGFTEIRMDILTGPDYGITKTSLMPNKWKDIIFWNQSMKAVVSATKGLYDHRQKDFIGDGIYHAATVIGGILFVLKEDNTDANYVYFETYVMKVDAGVSFPERFSQVQLEMKNNGLEYPMTFEFIDRKTYICSSLTNHIYEIDATNGKTIKRFGSCGSSVGQLRLPTLCASDCCRCLLIADCGNDRLQVFDTEHEEWHLLSTNEKISVPQYAFLTSEGTLAIASQYHSYLYILRTK